MSRLYDALKSAQASLPTDLPRTPLRAQQLKEDAPILALSQAIDARLSDRLHRVIQVIGCGSGEDQGTVARRLAQLSTVTLGRRVLFVDTSAQPVAAKSEQGHPAVGGLLPAVPAFEPPNRAARHPYHFCTLFDIVDGGGIAPQGLRSAWKRLRESYDLVLLESSSVASPVDLAIAPTVDGVVLVVEAEKTRRSKAEGARDALISSGANLLGVILDKRRYWIPRRLWNLT